MDIKRLTRIKQILLLLLSFFIVSFGQPTKAPWLGLIAACCGYAIFLRVILDYHSARKRFWLGIAWYTSVQLVYIYWMLSHPYSYIYAVYFALAFLLGLQWGIFCLLVHKESIVKISKAFALASLWTLFEWSRLYFLSGYSFNPAGLALSGHLYPLQFAALFGTFGLSFLVLLVNILALRAYVLWPKKMGALLWGSLALMPYAFGAWHFNYQLANKNPRPLKAVLVQTAFPAEEALTFTSKESYIAFVMQEWEKILSITKKQMGKDIDIIALPEYVVPFGTYNFIYPYHQVAKAFKENFGKAALKQLPPLKEPFAKHIDTNLGTIAFVNNAFWAQGIANVFNADVIAGLEDAEILNQNKCHYSAAIHFKPRTTDEEFSTTRYAKRVLLPMAEYIPFSFVAHLAKDYGISSSFTHGDKPVVMTCKDVPFSAAICYEETFGDLMSENKRAGAHLLISLSSDVWYPNSELPQQHCAHARLRTVENGMPLLRACNTGVTCAIDCHGQTIAMLGDGSQAFEWLADSLYVSLPTHNYPTLYAAWGDHLILIISLLGLLLFLL